MSGTTDVIDAVSLITVPAGTVLLICPAIVAVNDAPTASEATVTVRLLPDPPHIPEFVEVQETKVVSGGRLLVTVMVEAAAGPLFVTVIM